VKWHVEGPARIVRQNRRRGCGYHMKSTAGIISPFGGRFEKEQVAPVVNFQPTGRA
jgi:hypothetical protein